MIFASDLDRTLVYSHRALMELEAPSGLVLRPIEMKDGKPVGFMTETSFSMLKELCKQSLFIPVTTRTTEQYKRFVSFEKDINPTYVITSNGANILYKGVIDKDWNDSISKQLKNEIVPKGEFLSILNREGFIFEGELRHAENLFFYYLLNSLPPLFDRDEINHLSSQYGWTVSLQGRKLYFIPRAISKGAALSFICNREGKEAFAGAGDSFLDWDFLRKCTHRFVPRHGELAGKNGMRNFTLTKNSGAAAGEEILQQFLSLVGLKI